MSSLARRIQIRALKRGGYRRTRQGIVMERGRPALRPVRRGGLILNPNGDFIGSRWPGIAGAATGLEPIFPMLLAAAIAQGEKRSLVG